VKKHPREEPVAAAHRAIQAWLIRWRQEYDLTLSEEVTLLARMVEDAGRSGVKQERGDRH
jgi:hypothetical protein